VFLKVIKKSAQGTKSWLHEILQKILTGRSHGGIAPAKNMQI
jgi:hypothetical protein